MRIKDNSEKKDKVTVLSERKKQKKGKGKINKDCDDTKNKSSDLQNLVAESSDLASKITSSSVIKKRLKTNVNSNNILLESNTKIKLDDKKTLENADHASINQNNIDANPGKNKDTLLTSKDKQKNNTLNQGAQVNKQHKLVTRSELKNELSVKLAQLKLLSNRDNKVARVKIAVPEVRHSQIKKRSDRLIVSFNDIFYSSNLLSKINLYIFAHRKGLLVIASLLVVFLTISFGVGFGYFKKYKGFPSGGNFALLPGYIVNQPTYDPTTNAVFASGGNGPSLANVFQWGQISYNSPLNNFNGQIYYMGNSTSTNARDGLDVKEQRWGAVHRDNLLYKYSNFDGPTLRFGNDINRLTNKKLWGKYFTHEYYVKKTKKKIYPGDMQKFHDAFVNNLLVANTPIITYDDRFKINEKKQSAGRINKMTNLLYTVLQQGTIVRNSIGLPVSITGGGADGNAYLRDPYITWVDLVGQDKYKNHSKSSLKKHPEIANDFFTSYIKNSFTPHKGLITDDSRLGPANVKHFPLFCILDQNAYYYPSLGSNVLARVPSAKIFVCTSPLKIFQIVNFYYWIFSKQSDSIHDNNYWDDSNIHN